MFDLDIIKAIEKQIGEKLALCRLNKMMDANVPPCYVLDTEKQVTALNLQNCKLSNLTFIKNLKHLVKLNLAFNTISDLTPLESLYSLSELNLQTNKISNVDPLYNLGALKVLKLSSNKISNFEALGELNTLVSLDLSDNEISSLLPLKTMSELIELDLRFNKISNLIGLNNHLKLVKIFLNSNQIKEIKSLNNLPVLTQLYLSSNKIKDISALENLKSLVLLDLRTNNIENLDDLAHLKNLLHLHLESNNIQDITPLKNLSSLIQVNLKNNKIINIEALKNFKKLSHLYLSDNQIKFLPKWLLNFKLPIKWNTLGQGICINNNPIELPPIEIIKQGNESIKKFFNSTKKNTHNKVKIVLIGDSGVGKTSLSKTLRKIPFVEPQIPTLGINIDSWEHENVNANLWDFSGEQNLLATHKLFFSQRSLYILVLDNRGERYEERWLKCLERFSDNSSVLIVLNKVDEKKSYDIDRKYLLQRYKILRGVFLISCVENVGIQVLKQGIITALRHIETSNTLLSKNDFKIRESLLKQQQKNPCTTYDNYLEICNQEGMIEKEKSQNLLKLLHDLGDIVYLNNINTKENYILEPNWIIQALYKITNSLLVSSNNGQLFLNDLPEILKNKKTDDYNYPNEKHSYLINLLIQLNLCCRINDDSILIPQLLNKNSKYINFDEDSSLEIKIQYNYLDESIIINFIITIFLQIDFNKSNRYRLFLKNKNLKSIALLEINYHENFINLKINGKNKREYLSLIRETLHSSN